MKTKPHPSTVVSLIIFSTCCLRTNQYIYVYININFLLLETEIDIRHASQSSTHSSHLYACNRVPNYQRVLCYMLHRTPWCLYLPRAKLDCPNLLTFFQRFQCFTTVRLSIRSPSIVSSPPLKFKVPSICHAFLTQTNVTSFRIATIFYVKTH